jgi:hypothetical protein
MPPPASPAVRKAHTETARTLLHVEALGLHVLKGAVAQVGPGDPIAVARRSHDIVAATVLDIRAAARMQGAVRFGAEIAAAGASIPLPDLKPPTDLDRLAAERAARGYSDVLVKQAQEWFAEHDAAQANPVLRADAAYLESIAATETSAAFNDERTRIEKALAAENEESSWWPLLVKEWSADLEAAHRAKARGKKTKSGRAVSGPCDVCRGLHGTKIAWGSDWPGGHEPGKIHRGCRCLTKYYAIPFEVTRRKAA